MQHFQTLILAAIIGAVIATFPRPVAATTKDEALELCVKRGPQCKSLGLGEDPENDILICVDNRSTGHGVQCVRCQGNAPCSVLREIPAGGQKPGLSEVEGVLTDSIEPADIGDLEERIRTLEDRVNALEKR
jgi:hypothetical protein